MTISDLIIWLQQARVEHGDILVQYDTLSHTFDVDPAVRDRVDHDGEPAKVVVINS